MVEPQNTEHSLATVPVMAAAMLTAAALFLLAVSSGAIAESPGEQPHAAANSSAAVANNDVLRPEEGEVYRLYRSVLGRAPDRSGFDYWVAARIEGLTLRAVADGFLNSGEYARRFGAGSDGAFLDLVYRNVLGRPGDQSGVDYWLGELAGGLARTELVLLFSDSPENRTLTGTHLVDVPEFSPSIATVAEADIAQSWRSGCPVGPAGLRAVEIDFINFEGQHARGTLVVNVDVVDEVLAIFERLYGARYPISGMVPIDAFAGDDDASMAANNTSAFNCRAVTGGTSWSRHSYGTAIDINPIQNPYVSGLQVLPPAGGEYVDRAIYHRAMIRSGDVVTAAFADAGWRWGGDFRTIRDYQHFDR